MSSSALIGIDVGATSIKAGAFDDRGRPLAIASRPNRPVRQNGQEEWRIWDARALRRSVADALREVIDRLPPAADVAAVAVTGFGADGAPFSAGGEQRYPIISWHDARATHQAQWLGERVSAERIYALTGYHVYPINTLARWRWLVETLPHTLEGSRWLMVPDIVAFWLSGELRTDPTSASTTMAFELARDDWSNELLALAGVPKELPAERAEPGERIGSVSRAAAEETGLPEGIAVVMGGHDCEVGTFSATAELPESTFIDITGTWEMLIVIRDAFEPEAALFEQGVDWERHTLPESYICQSLMPAGSVLGWVKDLAFGDDSDGWETMIAEAEKTEIGAEGVVVLPAFVAGIGPFARQHVSGTMLGLRTTTTRGQIARAAFESLSYQLRTQLDVLERAAGRSCSCLRVLGGGQRNDFWLQLKADVTGRVAEALETEELTLLGAALLAGVGAGVYENLAEAQRAVSHHARVFEPHPGRHERYTAHFERGFRLLPGELSGACAVISEPGT